MFDLRKQVIWGNKFIKNSSNKTLLFHRWIDSDILFIDNILSVNGTFCETKVLQNLKDKRNWLSEFNIIVSSIPRSWKEIIKNNAPLKSKVKTELKLLGSSTFNINKLSNKQIYNTYMKKSFEKPFIHSFWKTRFNTNIPWSCVYESIHNNSPHNKIIQFRYKLIHNIIATKENLKKWKIDNSDQCNVCNCTETYEHFFITCKSIANIIQIFKNIFISMRYGHNIINLQSFILGYKTNFKQHESTNFLLNIMSFTLYKTYYMSEKRTKSIDVMTVFKRECNVALSILEENGTKQVTKQMLQKVVNQF